MSKKAFTASYSQVAANFVCQNLPGDYVPDEYTPAICVLKNLLQRGNPTRLSDFLKEHVGELDTSEKPFIPINHEQPNWQRTIRGDNRTGYNPAQEFYEEIIPAHLPDYAFVRPLILPEALISDMLPESDETSQFIDQQVDFYLPQAFLVIEIDGSQHKQAAQEFLDGKRDKLLEKHGLYVVRLAVADLQAKNAAFHEVIDKLKQCFQTHEAELKPYRIQANGEVMVNSPAFRKAAVMRFQLLVLELLLRGSIRLTDPLWTFNLREHDTTDFAEIALDDLFIWLKNLLRLQAPERTDDASSKRYTMRFDPSVQPRYVINSIEIPAAFPTNDGLNIDFSLLKRWTDEADANPATIYVRTDYIDRYPTIEGGKLAIQKVNHFRMSVTQPVVYHMVHEGPDETDTSLLFFLKNLFGHGDGFRSGQLGIIENALARKPTIGLLPTGSGKSICYQLPALLQPAISIVVCPIKALMRDQVADLHDEKVSVNQVDFISSELDPSEKARVQKRFSEGRYFFVFVSPERFQSQAFREAFSQITANYALAYAVIDEAHCLSEWGHDFRTSYLNLTKTIKRLSPASCLLGLTATASLNVLKDLQVELDVDADGVKTLPDYGREELTFEVIDDKGWKLKALTERIQQYQTESKLGKLENGKLGSGLIFTAHVNLAYGCYTVAQKLSASLNESVKWYAGSMPNTKDPATKLNVPVMPKADFDAYKQKVQDGFKRDEFTLMTATKAFGMGINKSNIRMTAHYGLPASMESLYQEAGRAGRDHKPADCLVFFTREKHFDVVNDILAKDTFLEAINDRLAKMRREEQFDLFAQFFLLTTGLGTVKDDVAKLREIASLLTKSLSVRLATIHTHKESDADATEKAIYRLMLLGLVEDWTVDWKAFGGNTFTVYLAPAWSAQSCEEALTQHIKKYDADFTLYQFARQYPVYIANLRGYFLYMTTLVVWTYVSIVANRKQSLKTVYENCLDVIEGRKDAALFKKTLEDYFKFDGISYVLQSISEQTIAGLQDEQVRRWFYNFFRVVNPLRKDLLIPTNEVEWSDSKLATPEQLATMQSQLSRSLEARGNNAGLNVISGLLRATNNGYDNSDGRTRFEQALGALKQTNNPSILTALFTGCRRVGNHIADREGRYEVAQSILRVFPDQQKHVEQWADSLQLPELLFTDYRQRLNQVKRLNRQLYEQTTGVG